MSRKNKNDNQSVFFSRSRQILQAKLFFPKLKSATFFVLILLITFKKCDSFLKNFLNKKALVCYLLYNWDSPAALIRFNSDTKTENKI